MPLIAQSTESLVENAQIEKIIVSGEKTSRSLQQTTSRWHLENAPSLGLKILFGLCRLRVQTELGAIRAYV